MPGEFQSLAQVARAIAAGTVSPVEVMTETLARIESLNPTLNAFISLNDRALDDARRAERAVRQGRVRALTGVPISLKDLILTRRGVTTAGSRIFGDGLTSDHDAPVAAALLRAGAIVVGKNNLHELALGVTNLNAHFGPARNPWDTTRVPGGSSGGSAVAVAAGMGYASVGSDTRGSIRIPAACCGVTGLKPTYGLVSTEDVVPLAWSLDHVGPITRTVEDAAIMLGAMVGGRATARYAEALRRPPNELRIGIVDYCMRDLDAEVEQAVLTGMEVLRSAGAIIETVAMPELDGSHWSSAVLTGSEALTYHDERLRQRPESIGTAVRERLVKAYDFSALDVIRAERHKSQVTAAFTRVLGTVDCIAGATLPATATRIGDDSLVIRGRETSALAEFPRLTSPANLSGVPALSLPCGFTREGLPVGLQLMAGLKREDVLFTAGAAFQAATDWHRRIPPAA